MSLRNSSTERCDQRELDRQARECLGDPLHAAVLAAIRKYEKPAPIELSPAEVIALEEVSQ